MEEPRTRLTWVSTTGGPHLVVPERYASAWEAYFSPTGGRKVEAAFRANPEGPATDYDRACDVSGWLGVIPVGRAQALVLRGADTDAAYYRWGRRHFLLQWYCAPSETALLDHVHDVWSGLPVEEEVVLRHPGGKLFLMDAADLPGRWEVEHAEFELPRGRYRVLTSHSRSEEIDFIVHQLRRDRG
jgi:hypothetical protein